MSKLVVTHLSHDFQTKKSFVSFVWSDDPTKRLGLEVPFGTAIADAETAALAVLRAFAAELEAADIVMP